MKPAALVIPIVTSAQTSGIAMIALDESRGKGRHRWTALSRARDPKATNWNVSIIPLTNLLHYLEDRAYGRTVQQIRMANPDGEKFKVEVDVTSARDKLLYPDWAAEDDELADAVDPETKNAIIWTPEAPKIYHLAFDAIGKRGNGLLTACLGWTREHRRFMEARVAITQALAKFAWKFTAKGGQNVVNAITTLVSAVSFSPMSQAPARSV
jgi:hypothetical protein